MFTLCQYILRHLNLHQIGLILLVLFMCGCSSNETEHQDQSVEKPLQFELENNFIANLSFITGHDRGIEVNLDDNFQWMKEQGYTHLRFFGIFPNGYHTFPSPTLDANGYPSNPNLEATLEILIIKAREHNVIINFDGWEIIAEANRDPDHLGVDYITEEELKMIVSDVLSLGVKLISEEQFGSSYLQAIQAVTSAAGAKHETTAGFWWTYDSIADVQLASVFSFYHYDQEEMESIASFPPSNLGNLQIYADGARYFQRPFSIAVGSFGTLETENWKNVLLFSQLKYRPDRFSIEETNTDLLIWDPTYNFMAAVGNEIRSCPRIDFENRPLANLVYDSSWLYNPSFRPVFNAGLINDPAIGNTLTLLGYQVVTTIDYYLPDADIYYLEVVGGKNQSTVAALPDFVMPLLQSGKPVFLQPVNGIPDSNDSQDWTPVRDHFGLAPGDTVTLSNAIPETVVFNNFTVHWGGVSLYITPVIEKILFTQIDTGKAEVMLTGQVQNSEVALIIRNGPTYLINSGVIHLEASYILSSLLAGPLNAPAIADISIVEKGALIFAEYGTMIEVQLPWSGLTRIMHYNPQGTLIRDDIIEVENYYGGHLSRGELVILTKLF